MQGDGQRIELHGYCGEQGYRHKAFEDVQSRLPNVPSAGGILDAALKGADHQAYAEKRPAQLGEELHDRLHPGQLEQLHAHVSHLLEKVPEETDDLAVDPIQDFGQYGRGHKVPYEHRLTSSYMVCSWCMTGACVSKSSV